MTTGIQTLSTRHVVGKGRTALVCLAAWMALAGCSSIAFYPAVPAQKAADRVIDDIWPAQPANQTTAAKEQPKDAAKEGAATPSPASASSTKAVAGAQK
jgi:hypothetical protein